MCIGLLIQYPLVFSDFNETNFLDTFSKNIPKSNFTKTLLEGGGSSFSTWTDGETDRQTNKQIDIQADMTNSIVAFHDFGNDAVYENIGNRLNGSGEIISSLL
jgi:hypothetical protein